MAEKKENPRPDPARESRMGDLMSMAKAPMQDVWWCFHPIRMTNGKFGELPVNHWLIKVGPYFYENSNGGPQELLSEVSKSLANNYEVRAVPEDEFKKQYDRSPKPHDIMWTGKTFGPPVTMVKFANASSYRRPFGCFFLGQTRKTHYEILDYMEGWKQGKTYRPLANFERPAPLNEANCHMLVMHMARDFMDLKGDMIGKLWAPPQLGYDTTLEASHPGLEMFPCKLPGDAAWEWQKRYKELEAYGLHAPDIVKYQEELQQERARRFDIHLQDELRQARAYRQSLDDVCNGNSIAVEAKLPMWE